RKPLSLLVKTISPFRNLLTITGVTWTISPSRILGDMLPPRASKRTHTPAFSSSRLSASNISESEARLVMEIENSLDRSLVRLERVAVTRHDVHNILQKLQ